MSENVNLALDIDQIRDPSKQGGRGHRVARVYVELACSYLKSQGAPTLTADCRTLAELEAEIERIKVECDALLEEARVEFGAASPAAAQEVERPAEPSAIPRKTASSLLVIDGELLVRDQMTRDVQTMQRNDKLSVASELMKVGGFRHVVVLEDDGEEVAGVVSHRDIFYGALAWSSGQGRVAHDKALDALPVKDAMHADVVKVSPDMALTEAAQIMLKQKIGCLPVVHENRLVGILTEGDFLSLLVDA